MRLRPGLEGEGPGRVRDEDPLRKLLPELALEAWLEAAEDVVEPRTASVGTHHRTAAGVPAEEQAVAMTSRGKGLDQREDRRVGPVLRPPGPVQLQPRARRCRLGMLAGIGVSVEVGEDDGLCRDSERAEELDEGEPHRPVLRVDADRRSGSGVRLGSCLDRRPLEGCERVVARADLDEPAANLGPGDVSGESRRPRVRTLAAD